MRIEKLNENKIRIFLNLEDLKEKNIDLHTFMSNSLESQSLFMDLLNQAEIEVGFQTNDYKLMIEALASNDGNFIFTITREKPEGITISKHSTLKPKVKRQSVTHSKLLSIYLFNSFDEFCEFCEFITSKYTLDYISKLKNSSLVLYKNNYYLIFNNLKLTLPELKNFSCSICEFATKIRNENLMERKFKEHGKILIAKNAILTCLKYFSNK